MAKLPFNLTKSLKALREASASAGEPASIVLAGDQALVERAREQFSVGGTVPAVATTGAVRRAVRGVAAGSGRGSGGAGHPRAGRPRPRLLLGARSPKKVGHTGRRRGAGHQPNRSTYLANGVVRLSFSDSAAGWDRLFSLCARGGGGQGDRAWAGGTPWCGGPRPTG